MNFFTKLLQDEKRRNRWLIGSLGVALTSALLIIATLVYQLLIVTHIPNLPMHVDISKRPVETYAASLNQQFPADAIPFKDSSCPALTQSGLTAENAKPGVNMSSADWRALQFDEPYGSLIWSDQNSVNCGDVISIHASTYDNYNGRDQKAPRTIAALRIGWYNGSGARLVWQSAPMKFPKLPIPFPKGSVRLVDTKWPVITQVKVDSSWTPGFYLLVSYGPNGNIESEAPLVVHNPRGTSKIAIMHSFLTWEMYNSFGGYSAYIGPGGTLTDIRANRGREVSFNRPYSGSGGFAIKRDGLSIMQFLEKNNILVDNYSDLDLSNNPSTFSHYNEIIISGHAEYMTRNLFDSFIAARNSGINLALFGANNAYWQTRLAPDKKVPDRYAYMYRVATQDPVTAWDKVTLEFSDKRINTPTTLITGAVTSGVHVYGTLNLVYTTKWLKIPAKAKITELSPDSEIETSVASPATPPNIHPIFQGVLNYAVAPNTAKFKKPVAESIWFTTPSGSAVFNGGFTTWACDLADSCVYPSISPATENLLQNITLQIIKLWSDKGIGKTLK